MSTPLETTMSASMKTMDRETARGCVQGVVWSPHWRFDLDPDGTPVLSAGGDLRLALRGLDHELVATVRAWAADGVPETLTPRERRLADRLLDAGALARPCSTGVVRLVGDGRVGARILDAAGRIDGPGELAVVLRTGAAWPEPPEGPYVAVDCAYHHTVVLGPYVVPGLSACLGCLRTRMARRWPDHAPPARPKVQSSPSVIGELLRIQLEAIGRGTSPLLNATVAWDLSDGSVRRETLLKLPGCPVCDYRPSPGRLPLPWTTPS